MIDLRARLTVFLIALISIPEIASAAPIEVDVCIYGGTSGGVSAAVQAARMGKRVTLVEPGRYLGGMTSGGLSAVDIGDPPAAWEASPANTSRGSSRSTTNN
jgi:NADPH-dependent 2,4-dienoyl-CoA reductase/sulfur reductase-like enzyme